MPESRPFVLGTALVIARSTALKNRNQVRVDQQTPTVREWGCTAILLTLLLVYVFSFWGQAARLLPAPLDAWHDIYFRLFSDWWHRVSAGAVPAHESSEVFRAIEAYLLGFFVPIIVLKVTGRSPSDAGLRMQVKGTAWLVIALALPAVLFGIVLSLTTEEPWGSPLYEVLELAAMLPEHFLIFGVVIAAMLPDRRLVRHHVLTDGADGHRLSQSPPLRAALSNREIVAVTISGIVFQMVHIGAPTLEVFLALPVGLLFSYTTLLTQSIWPALVIHWALNLIPMAWMALQSAMI